MSENELRALKFIQYKNVSLAIVAGCTTTGLFYMSSDWFSLFGMLPMLMMSTITTSD